MVGIGQCFNGQPGDQTPGGKARKVIPPWVGGKLAGTGKPKKIKQQKITGSWGRCL